MWCLSSNRNNLIPKKEYTLVKRTDCKMTQFNTLEHYVKVYQVLKTIVYCIDVLLKLLIFLITHKRNVGKSDMNVTQI